MNFEDLNTGVKCKLKVIPEKSQGNFFTVVTDDDQDFQIPKIKFQKDSKFIPEWLYVYVRNNIGGYPHLVQDLSEIIPQFYTEGKDYEFRVKGRRPGDTRIYEVEDENGLYFRLPNPPVQLAKGRRVKCKITKIKGTYVKLLYTGQLDRHVRLTFYCVDEWVEKLAPKLDFKVNPRYLNFYLKTSPDFSETLRLYNLHDARWIISALSVFWQNITKYLIATRSGDRVNIRMRSRLIAMMKICSETALLIIEGSDYLKDCNSELRTQLQDELSGYIEAFRQVTAAAELMAEGREEEFVDNILENLKQAGYLYHPRKQFRIMMTVLRLRPELISDNKDTGRTSRITALFEALHSWPVANWMEEPFRSALVEQLEIFISENSSKVENLFYNNNGDDNRQLNRIIRAIAIQSLLAKPSDNIDISHNRALLYRYLSFFHSDDIDPLLYKSVGAILGNDFIHDFSWDDTSRIQLLQEKASFCSEASETASSHTKVFSNGDLAIELSGRKLTLRTRFADEEGSVLPNDTLKWLNPEIYLRQRVKTPAASKKNDINAYRTMWADIEAEAFKKSIFSTATSHKRQSLPEEGDEVDIVIDGFDVDNKEEKMRFHCRIVSEYIRGSGWLTISPEYFLPWLDYRDYPANYNGDLSIFKTEEGEFLSFPAIVINTPEDEENIQFSMREFLEDFTADLPVVGEVSHAVIRKVFRANGNPLYYDHYLCLSDRGYTVKVSIPAEGTPLLHGSHINVRYLELEKKSSTQSLQFMVGEIAEVTGLPNNYGKLTPLRNLFQAFGNPNYSQDSISESESMEVVEAQDVMSREEVGQLILLLQRRAYVEKEYIQAFNYLGLAAVLCRAIDDDSRYDEMKIHQDLLAQLQFYARNKKVDLEVLEKYRDNVAQSGLLSKLYNKLDIVSSISRPDTNAHLWEIASSGDDTEKRLASLVLSYNLLPEDSSGNARKEVMSQISNILNVNANDIQAKYYGEEDQHVEFKSSLIFTNRQKDRMLPRPEAQTREILQIICGFLNSEGGMLYIGVNDLGYEAGLHDDLSFRRFKKKKASLDGMIVDLERAIHYHLPENAWNAVKIASDPESTKGVIVVETTPVKTPVYFENTIFVRNSSSTRARTGEELKSFLANRTDNYNKWIALQQKDLATTPESSQNIDEAESTDAPLSPPNTESLNDFSEITITNTPEEADENGRKALTGRHRTNVLHDGFEDFVYPLFYLHFNADHTFNTTTEDLYCEYEPDKLAVLAVKKEERSKWLIATFTDGTVSRTGIGEIEEVGAGAPFRKDSHLAYVDIADINDYLLTYLKNSAGFVYVRVDRIADLAESRRLKSPGKRLLDGDFEIICQDILDETRMRIHYGKAYELSERLPGLVLKLPQHGSIPETIEEELSRAFA
ncbi:MAG: ATP-binding protein [Clostridium sp.]|nr:ATP-binding protein [Prevotella sp.]MCM1428545.1 ATP-binding protein [Clostridium sp.]MCM1475009.1 ATP-binding protein [Muribaculaceae bacterium]